MDLRDAVLKSHRLVLRPFAAADADDALAVVTLTLTRHLSFDPPPSADAFAAVWRTWAPKMAAGTDAFLTVRRRDDGILVGMSGLHGIESGAAEAGIWIAESAQGRGYGREAVARVGAWAFEDLGLPFVEYSAVMTNRASRRIAESLGGVQVGTRPLRKASGVELPMAVYRISPPPPS